MKKLLAGLAIAAALLAAPASTEAATSPQSLEALTGSVTAALNQYWTEMMTDRRTGRSYWVNPKAAYFRDAQNLVNACGSGVHGPAAFYCPTDSTIYLNREFFLWQRSQLGDGGVVVVLAHEWGHHAQRLLGLPASEEGADCDAGNFLAWSARRGYLEVGDYEGAVYAAIEAGSDNPRDPHGTSWERTWAVGVGYGLYSGPSCIDL